MPTALRALKSHGTIMIYGDKIRFMICIIGSLYALSI